MGHFKSIAMTASLSRGDNVIRSSVIVQSRVNNIWKSFRSVSFLLLGFQGCLFVASVTSLFLRKPPPIRPGSMHKVRTRVNPGLNSRIPRSIRSTAGQLGCLQVFLELANEFIRQRECLEGNAFPARKHEVPQTR